MTPTFPPELPISAHVDELTAAIAAHQVVIVAGETGSGKTTQLPKICLAMGRERIGCTQPRRIAATSVAARVAQELESELGQLVGYKIRFDNKSGERPTRSTAEGGAKSNDKSGERPTRSTAEGGAKSNDKLARTTRVKFMTDGILLAEIQSDPLLRAYDTLIIDEAHERSLNIDFLLGFIKRLLPQRPDLRVIVSSATLELERFAKFFDRAPVVSVSGRTYPVDVLYRPPGEDETDLAEVVANAIEEITELDPRGDVLVFLPGEREIREALGELEQHALPHTILLPLYGRLSAAEQQRVFVRVGQRRIVLATNVAETSLTIPGIVYVVDAGLARVNRYDPRTGVSQLFVEPVSRASADQRKGRCGRTQHGVCFRLYEEQDYASRPAHTDPEIKRVSLAGVILRMKTLRLGEIEHFPFLDPPQQRAISDGYRVLEELGAIDEAGELTTIGHQLGRLPLDPRLARMILGGRDEHALREVVVIAAALGLQDPRERPQAVQQKADEAHRRFRDEGSDFAGYLKLWEFWKHAKATTSRRQLQRQCRDNFLNYNRMREWDDIHDQIVRVMKELDFAPNPQPASTDQIHRALLPGLLSKIGMWNKEARNFTGARGIKFVIHPSSALAKKPPQWVMAAELVETSQLFARTVAKLDPAWLEAAAGDLCRHSYGDPHWDQKQGQVIARDHVTLYGLPVASRQVSYAKWNPALCRELFITHALVRGEFTTKAPFVEHNKRVQAEAQRLRDKARRSDMFADDSDQFAFFDQRIPPTVVDGATFGKWYAQAKPKLELSLADVLLSEAHDLAPARFPDRLTVRGVELALTYRFDPGEDDDGITITVPVAMLPQLDADAMTWTIAGWMQPKIVALLESLPKAQRKPLAPIDLLAHELASSLPPFEGALLPALERAVFERTGERIARSAWDVRTVPQYLSFNYRVVDHGKSGEGPTRSSAEGGAKVSDKVLGAGRDLEELQRALGQRAREAWATAPRETFERTGIRSWDFATLPESVTIEVGGRKMRAYPALVDRENHVDLRLLESPAVAAEATREGLRRLLLFATGQSMSKLDALLPSPLAKDVRRQILLRALDDAFELADPPRDKAAFEKRATAGRGVAAAMVAELGKTAQAFASEVDKVRTALKPLAGKPGLAKAVYDDITSQLAHVAPADLWSAPTTIKLDHRLRYVKALQIRLQRQAHDPPKDQTKAAQVVPLWTAYVARRGELLAKGRTARELDDFGWLLEELRVAVFAPELKTAVPVSLPRVQEQWTALVR